MAIVKSKPEAIRGLNASDPRTMEAIDRNFDALFKALSRIESLAGEEPESPLPSAPVTGDILYFDGTDWVSLPIGTSGQALKVSSGLPAWATLLAQSFLGLDAANLFAYIARSTIYGIGATNGTSAGGTLFIDNQTDSTYVRCQTGAIAGNISGFDSNTTDNAKLCQTRHEPTVYIVMRTYTDISNLRIWIGLTDANFTDNDTQASGNHIAFRYSTVVPDAGWVASTRDGATQSTTAVGPALATDTRYVLKIRVSGSSVFFSVNGGTEVEKTTNIPASTTAFQFSFRVITRAAAAKSILVSRVVGSYGS